ncbi:EAL domain-containing protein [Rhodococcoides yunnanense]|uniref:EAL domain-containing protein n=1 Tax=Rhodococcoides yunnanense TaxID=278209 RepID=UPI0009FDD0D0|nr:EAL domain-containing protein [Rhodococcus yunnanensis]
MSVGGFLASQAKLSGPLSGDVRRSDAVLGAEEHALNRGPNNERWARVLIGGLAMSFGLAGILMIPSGQFTSARSIYVAVAALSTVPVAVVWFLSSWSRRRLANVYVLYADIGILAVMLSFETPFIAMAGSAMFSVVAVFAIVSTSPRTLALHLVGATAALLLIAVLSILDGTNPWTVASQAVIFGSLFAVPFALRPYIRHLRRQAQVALRDSLTGLWNRRGLFDVVEHLNKADVSTRTGPSVIGVMVIDIDRFKSINDTYGHPSGDAVLVEVANRLSHAASKDSAVSRLGGDEFVCVHIGSPTEVDEAESRIRAALEESFSGPPFTTSIGSAGDHIIKGDATGALVRRLVALADIELYRNKTQPRSVDPGARADPLQIRQRMTSLIESGGPTVVFQPICNTATRAVVGFEALSRFPFGHGSPMIWFRDATQAGIGTRLELAAIDNALRAMETLPAHAFVSLNASAETIRSTDLHARLAPHIGTRTLYLEITEHERVDDYRSVARSVEDLRAAGVRISVDDVGAGFSGLRQVVELKPDALKVDYALVHGIDKDPTRRAAAAALAGFAREVGSTLILEGVETSGELRVALELGVEMVQGFLTGRPDVPSAYAES